MREIRGLNRRGFASLLLGAGAAPLLGVAPAAAADRSSRIASKESAVSPDLADGRWPAGFRWGSASSATQTEGATPADDWWAWEQAGKAPASGDGNDFDRRFREDFGLLAGLGLTDNRVSLDWARLEPRPGEHDHRWIEHYREMLRAGRAAGLSMWVCLLHTALPAWFAADGGFLAADAMGTWTRHVDFVAETFGDLVDGWMPINNPTSYAMKGYLTGTFPPGHTSQAEFGTVLGAVHLADFSAALRLRQGGQLTSCNESLAPIFPADDSDAAKAAAALVDSVVWNSWLGLATSAPYDAAFDLIGFSYYYGIAVTAQGQTAPYPPGEPLGAEGYVIWPQGLGQVLNRLAQELPGRRLLVAELGYGGEDDHARERYLRAVFDEVRAALDSGIDIAGTHVWTGVDNYEWTYGFTVPFGLFDRERRPRPSAALVRELVR